MIDVDSTPLIVQIIPAQAQCFTDATARSQQHRKQRPPVAVDRVIGDMLHERPLLWNRQSMAYTGGLFGAFLYLCQHTIGGVLPNNFVSNRQLKGGMKKCMFSRTLARSRISGRGAASPMRYKQRTLFSFSEAFNPPIV